METKTNFNKNYLYKSFKENQGKKDENSSWFY